MFKVRCIKQGPWRRADNPAEVHPGGPKYGDICTVKHEYDNGYGLTYLIVEHPDPYGYNARWFIPLSNIDETEMVRDYNFEKVEI